MRECVRAVGSAGSLSLVVADLVLVARAKLRPAGDSAGAGAMGGVAGDQHSDCYCALNYCFREVRWPGIVGRMVFTVAPQVLAECGVGRGAHGARMCYQQHSRGGAGGMSDSVFAHIAPWKCSGHDLVHESGAAVCRNPRRVWCPFGHVDELPQLQGHCDADGVRAPVVGARSRDCGHVIVRLQVERASAVA